MRAIITAAIFIVFLQACSSTKNISEEQLTEVWSSVPKEGIEQSQEYTPLWLQPANQHESCLVLVSTSGESDGLKDVTWDGDCENGYALGLGRVFLELESESFTSTLMHFKGTSEPPKLYYHVDYNSNFLYFTELKSDSETFIGLQVTVNDTYPFDVEYIELYEDGRGFTTARMHNLSSRTQILLRTEGTKTYRIDFTNSYKSRVFANLSTLQNNQAFGFSHWIFHDGNTHSEDLLTEEPVTLPTSFFEKFEAVQRSANIRMPSVKARVRSAEDAISQYKNKICNDKIPLADVPEHLYFGICEEQGDLHRFANTMERRAKRTQRNEEQHERQYAQMLQQAQLDRQAAAAGFQQFVQSLNEIGNSLNQAGQNYQQAAQQYEAPTQYNWAEQVQTRPRYYEYEYNPSNNLNLRQTYVRTIRSGTGRLTCEYSLGARIVLPYSELFCPEVINR